MFGDGFDDRVGAGKVIDAPAVDDPVGEVARRLLGGTAFPDCAL